MNAALRWTLGAWLLAGSWLAAGPRAPVVSRSFWECPAKHLSALVAQRNLNSRVDSLHATHGRVHLLVLLEPLLNHPNLPLAPRLDRAVAGEQLAAVPTHLR